MIPSELIEIQNFLIANPVKLSSQLSDGRINASINEREILEKIKTEFDIEIPPDRHWYDFSIKNDKEKIPVNIKVTSTTTADNVQCKLGIYYALTGIWPDFSNGVSWEEYFKRLRSDLNKNKDKDYYFLIVNKNNHRDVFCTSLKKINNLVANGNNLPFQCVWGNNRSLESRTHDEAVKFILGKLRESIQLRAKIIDEFNYYFEDFL